MIRAGSLLVPLEADPTWDDASVTERTRRQVKRSNELRVGGIDDPYAFVVQRTPNLTEREKQAVGDLAKQIRERHEQAVEIMYSRLRRGWHGFGKLGPVPVPTDPFGKLSDAQRRALDLPDFWPNCVIWHRPHPTQLRDQFLYPDGDRAVLRTVGAQRGRNLQQGYLRFTTNCALELDGAHSAFQVIRPVDVKIH